MATRLLCLECGAEVATKPDEELDRCPACGDSAHIPADLDDIVHLNITRHELRVLTMWADNWGRLQNQQKAVKTIIDRIGMQTDAALTLSQELADVRAEFGQDSVRVIDGGGNEIDL